MSKKHYIEIAKALSAAHSNSADKEVIENLIADLSLIFKADNINFNPALFIKASLS